jgi:alpha-tubulin suppressor-like RCC1 family protein
MQIDNFQHEGMQVKCGINHTLILTKSGLVYGMGLNSEG